MQILIDFFDFKNLIPHGYCLSWGSFLLWLHVTSDLLIMLSYYSIPLSLAYFVRQRKDLPYPWLIIMSAVFIVACGTTHLLSVVTIWIPVYWLEGYVKAFTALVSVASALAIFWVIPLALKLPSPAQLQAEIERSKLMDKARQEALERLQKIAGRVPGMVYQFRMDVDGRFSLPYCSESIRDVLGLSLEQAYENINRLFERIHPDDYEHVVRSVQQSAQNLTLWLCEYRVCFENGRVRWLSGNAAPQREEDGATLWHGFITDITERKQKDIEYQTIIQTSFNGFWINDFFGRLLTVNDALCRMLGYSEPELLNMKIMDIEAVQTSDEIAAHIQAIIQTGHDTFETLHRRKDGTMINVEVNVLYVAALGRRFFVFVNDITERKLIEQRFRASEAQFRNTFENAPIGIVNVSLKGEFKAVNQTYCDIVGYTREELLAMTVMDVTRTEDKAIYAQFMQQLLAGERAYLCIEKQYVRKDGHLMWGNLSVKLNYHADGSPDYFIGTIANINDRKLAEEALKASEIFTISILKSLTPHITVLDEQGSIVMVNRPWKQFAKQNGLLEACQYMPSCNYLPCTNINEEEADIISGGIKAIKSGELQEFHSEYSCDSSHGKCWIYITVSLLADAKRMIVISRENITQRKLIEEALKASETRFRSMIEISPVPMGLTDAQMNVTYLNPAFIQTFGYDSSDIPTLFDWWPKAYPDPEYRQLMINNWNAPSTADKPLPPQERTICCKNGTKKTVLTSRVDIPHSAEDTRLTVFYDISERKQAETELRIAAIVFESHEGMLITDENETILKINQAFTDITGYSAAEVIGQTPRILGSGRHDKKFYAALWQSIHETGTWQGEIWNRRKNGEIYPEWLTITTVRNNNGVITHYVATLTDITERKAAEETITRLAFYDPLTQLANRRLLQERLKQGIEISRRTGHQMAVLMLDLDRFKAVNDTLGHAAGDQLLQQVAERIKACLRKVDMVARLGGDEFVVLMEQVQHYKNVARVAKAIIYALNKSFILGENNEVHIGGSIGISIHPQHGDNVDALMDNADTALYQAKDQGRGCFAYFSEEFTQKARERLALEARLRSAVEQHELRVYFQPQIAINSGRIIGAEALVRWHDPVKGCLMPKDFISLAEETGLIVDIGEWVLREICTLGQQWLLQGLPAVRLTVNISPYQFRRCNINALIAQVLHETGFPANSLELEITEVGLMDNQEQAMNILNNLRSQGVRLAIDDFGTGYSSLAYLKYFPLDVLKIDKTFISDIPFSPGDMAITATIISMAHHLGFKVLAEGVETQEQLAFLQELGCDMYQGYLFSKALPAGTFAELLINTQIQLNNSFSGTA